MLPKFKLKIQFKNHWAVEREQPSCNPNTYITCEPKDAPKVNLHTLSRSKGERASIPMIEEENPGANSSTTLRTRSTNCFLKLSSFHDPIC
jgi:hypothetical protein